ncbi:MAG: fibronectin type III domain-containing protein [Acutalibacteraceae bacterium]
MKHTIKKLSVLSMIIALTALFYLFAFSEDDCYHWTSGPQNDTATIEESGKLTYTCDFCGKKVTEDSICLLGQKLQAVQCYFFSNYFDDTPNADSTFRMVSYYCFGDYTAQNKNIPYDAFMRAAKKMFAKVPNMKLIYNYDEKTNSFTPDLGGMGDPDHVKYDGFYKTDDGCYNVFGHWLRWVESIPEGEKFEEEGGVKWLVGQKVVMKAKINADKSIQVVSYTLVEKHTHAEDWVVTKKPTCTKNGVRSYICKYCGRTKKTETIPATKQHTYKLSSEKPASFTTDGYKLQKCTTCSATKKTAVPKAVVSLSGTSFVYNGKVQKPTLTVKDSKGDKISSKYYTATWSNTSSKNVGTYKVTIKFKGNYTGTKTLTYKITPKQVTGLKVSSVKTTSITIAWSKVTGAKYYKLEKSTDGKKWTTVTTTDKTSYTVKSLKSGTKYQFRVTALDSTKKIAGKSSTVLKTATLTGTPSVTLKSSKSKNATASWKKVTGASKYVVYKSTDGKKWTKVTTTTKTSYTLTKLTGGKKIYVKVTALNAYGKASAASSVKNVTVKK